MKSYVGVNGVARKVSLGGQGGSSGARSIGLGTVCNITLGGTYREWIVVQRGLDPAMYGGGTADDIVLMSDRVALSSHLAWVGANASEEYDGSNLDNRLESLKNQMDSTIAFSKLRRIKIPYRRGNNPGSTTINKGTAGMDADIWAPSPIELGFPDSTDTVIPGMGYTFEYFANRQSSLYKKRIAYASDTDTMGAAYWTRSPRTINTSSVQDALLVSRAGVLTYGLIGNTSIGMARAFIVLTSADVRELAV